MCKECGCGIVGEVAIDGTPGQTAPSPVAENVLAAHAHAESAGHTHGPHESHAHHAGDGHSAHSHHTADVREAILTKNDRLAERNRGFFRAKGLLVLNVLSGPGSGKTTFIQKTAERVGTRLRLGVIVGDLATENDAQRLRSSGLSAVQITTGNACHLEADMIGRAMGKLDLDGLDVLIIENVGNLVCPAVYDLGEDLRVVLLSATEGEDKPLKYPPIFHSANVVVLNKMDLAAAAGFNQKEAMANLRRVSHHAEQIFEVSARTGVGMDGWCDYLVRKLEALRRPAASH